jgi:hypothetical protein
MPSIEEQLLRGIEIEPQLYGDTDCDVPSGTRRLAILQPMQVGYIDM